MADMHRSTRQKHQREAEQRVKRAGYRHGGMVKSAVPKDDEKQDKALVAKGVHQHEAALHKGEPKTRLRLRRGGSVTGQKAPRRTDKGGRGKGDLTLVIQNSNPAEKQQAAMKGMQLGAQIGARKAAAGMAAAHPPAPAAPRPGMPPGGMPPQPGMAPGMAPRPPMAAPAMQPRPQMVRRGGKVKGYVTVREHKRRRAGGAV